MLDRRYRLLLAHDHMYRAKDFMRDLVGGVSSKIVHLGVDAWLDAPTRCLFEQTYYINDGFLQRGLKTFASVIELEKCGEPIVIVRTFNDIEKAMADGKLALILGFEGGKVIEEDLGLIDAWFSLGLRHLQFNWAMRNSIGASQTDEEEPEQPGLSEFGFDVVSRMNRLGMMIDVSHSAPQTILDVLATTTKPVLNSHSGSREIAPKQQNLWDDQIRGMSDNGGVIGIHFCSRLVLGVNDRQAGPEDVVRQIEYVRNVGGIEVVGLGPDYILSGNELDKNYLRNTNQPDITWTSGLEDSSEVYGIVLALEKAGFHESDIDKITSGNMSRILKDVLPKCDSGLNNKMY